MLRHVTHARDAFFEYIVLLATVHICDRVFLMTGWVCQWKPFWIPVGDTFQEAYLEEWQRVDDGSMRDPGEIIQFPALPIRQGDEDRRIKTVPSTMSNLGTPHQHRDPLGKHLGNLMRLLGCSPEPWVLQPSGNFRRHHCLSQSVGANLLTRNSSVPFLNVWKCRIPTEILSGYEEDVSFIRDRFTTWVKEDPNDTLERHMVDVRMAFAEYREASVRRQEAPAQENFFDSSVPNRSSVQKWLSVYNLNPGPRRGKEGRHRKTNCGKMACHHLAGDD